MVVWFDSFRVRAEALPLIPAWPSESRLGATAVRGTANALCRIAEMHPQEPPVSDRQSARSARAKIIATPFVVAFRFFLALPLLLGAFMMSIATPNYFRPRSESGPSAFLPPPRPTRR